MASISDDSLVLEFVAEGKQHLASIEPDLLTLEKEGGKTDSEVINHIFRAIHSIKGASGFFGFESLKHLSHIMESVLMLIREGKLIPTPDIIDPLFKGVDKLNAMLDDVYSSDNVSCNEVIEQLESILTGHADGSASVKALKSKKNPLVLTPDPSIVKVAVSQGSTLYSIQVLLDADLAKKERTPMDFLELILSMGMVLDSVFDIDSFPGLDGCLNANLSITFMYATVLEDTLLLEAIDIPAPQIKTLNPYDFLNDESEKPPEPSAVAATQNIATTQKSQGSDPSGFPLTPTLSSIGGEGATSEVKNSSPPKAQSNEAPSKEPAKTPPQKPAGQTGDTVEFVRVKIDLLNKLMDLAGEMVLSRNQLIRKLGSDASKVDGLATIIQNVDLITTDLQEHIMMTRMQPIVNVFGKFPRLVRDLSRQLGKEIELQMTGEEVELDKSILESLSDPLTHLVRNCCDHALEIPEERLKAGKPKTGIIALKAFHEGGQINISIVDDGQGIDYEKIARKAISSGIVTESEVRKMSSQEMVNLIFQPGLSTAERVSDLSGRGVGMDVVRTNIEKLGGHISIDTAIGKGTSILLRLPLTLAIIPSLIVGVADQRFAIPQINLVELVCVKASEISTRIEKVGSADVLRLRGKLLPLLRLADVLRIGRYFLNPKTGEWQQDRRASISDERKNSDPAENTPPSSSLKEGAGVRGNPNESSADERRKNHRSDYYILVLKSGANQYGLIVDRVSDTEEIVVKPLSSYLKNCKCFAGATIMGDGRVAMILDAGGILAFSKLSFTEIDEEERRRKSEKERMASRATRQESLILFNNALDEIFALPLSSILRLEKFSPNDLEHIGSREFLTYRGKGLPLIRLENYLPVRSSPADLKEAYLIIPKVGGGAAGIVASQILDTIEVEVHLEDTLHGYPGISGSAIVNNHLTLFIEPQGLLEQAGVIHHKGDLQHVVH